MNRRNYKNNSNLPKGRRRRPGKKINQQNLNEVLNEARVPRALMGSSPFPMYMIRKLSFYEPNLVLQNPLASFVLKEWRINSVFDPDPLISGGTVSGFPQLAAIYQNYRVENFRVRFEVAGNEPGLPLSIGLCFKDAQPSSTVTTYLRAQDALEVDPTTGPHVIGETTGSSVYRSKWITIKPSAILGNPRSYMSDTAYASAVTTNPPQVVWMAFLLNSPSAIINLPNGCVLSIFMQFTTRFYSLRTTLDTLVFEELQSRRERFSAKRISTKTLNA